MKTNYPSIKQLLVFVLLIFGICAMPGQGLFAAALTWPGTTVDVNPGDNIQTAINTAQQNKGTVRIHAGTYSVSNLTISNPVRLIGDGQATTRINISGTITVSYSYGEILECTGLKFVGTRSNSCWKIDTGTICFKDNYFQNFGRYGFMTSEGGILDGVVSNCVFDRCSSGGYACFLNRGPDTQANFDIPTVSQSSAITAVVGAHSTLTNALFFEDCKFYLEDGYGPIGGAGGGSRMVYRRNEFYQYGSVDKILDAHGDQSWSTVGTRLTICYDNLFDATATNNDWQQGLHLRGGTAIVENNRFVKINTCATLATIEPSSGNPSTYLRAFFHGNTRDGSPMDASGNGIAYGYDGGAYTFGYAPEAPTGIQDVLPNPHPLLASSPVTPVPSSTYTSTNTASPTRTITPITPSATPTTPVPTDTPITPSATPTTPVATNTPVTCANPAVAGTETAPIMEGSSSGHAYIYANTDNAGYKDFVVTVSACGIYKIMAYVNSGSDAANSWSLEILGKTDTAGQGMDVYDTHINYGTWQWEEVKGRNGGGVASTRHWNLSPGTYTVRWSGREKNTLLECFDVVLETPCTVTPVPPTNTPVTPSATPTTPVPTDTPITPSATPTTPVPTNTEIVPTNTEIVPTATPTTPVPTNTPITPSATPTTPVPTSTFTKTYTPVPPTSTPTTGVSNITLKLKSGDTNNSTNSPHPQIRVVNTGTTALNLNNVEVRYWFNYDASAGSAQAWIDWAGKMPQGQTVSQNVQAEVVTQVVGTQTHYMRLRFTNSMVLQPNEYVEIQSRFNKNDWLNMLQSNDWSYAAYTDFTIWNRITGYVNGSLAYGQEPTAQAQGQGAKVAGVLSYPNPASGSGATLSYEIAGSSKANALSAQDAADSSGVQSLQQIPDPDAKVTLDIFTAAGRQVWKKELSGVSNVSTGKHVVNWDGKSAGGHELAAGTYILKVSVLSNNQVNSRSFVIIMLK